ncbi:MAG: squalene--hopene cyclase [Bryobacterales bacterium]|nr:squalene--hopene cyclase [Bryobacterales bacterium]
MSSGLQVIEEAMLASGAESMRKAVDYLLAARKPEGYWWGDLTADSTLESDWLLLLLWLHPPQGGVWTPPDEAKVARAVRAILAKQNDDGGFHIFADGPSDLSASVKAYFALKLAGLALDDSRMIRLRELILEMGGIQSANSYVKINMALFGLYPREHVPSVPPEVTLLPGHVLYEMSSWTRAIVVPLSIVQSATTDAPRPVPAGFTLQELFRTDVPVSFHQAESFFSWKSVALLGDKAVKWWERSGVSAGIRAKAIGRAKEWMLERLCHSEGLAAIYPSMQYAIMALDVLGYGVDSPERREAQKQFDALLVDDGERFFFQPCFSPVWDTAIAAHAVGETGLAPASTLRPAGDWLLTKEVRRKGDWAIKRPNTEPSGWYFEFANEFYPDIDDTAMVLMALRHTRASDETAYDGAMRRGVNWLLAMQSKDGGWAAFDVDNDWDVLRDVPFADHNAMLDPTCPDITGRVLEALCICGVDRASAPVRRGVEFLRKSQEADGSWYGRWGVNYIYGTFLALRGLRAAGYDDHEAEVLRGGEWLRSVQNADGGWGESCESYAKNTFVEAGSTASQTAWAVLGLLAGGDTTSESVLRGVEYLVKHQREDGGWDERLATGTGFPRVFYLTYHLYRQSFPTLALAEFMKLKNGSKEGLG